MYLSNSGDRPVVRGNVAHDNAASGIQLNADATMGGDGIIEGNVIYGNGVLGGASINLGGVEDSVIRNNLVHDAHASGIALFQNGGASAPATTSSSTTRSRSPTTAAGPSPSRTTAAPATASRATSSTAPSPTAAP